MNESVRDRHNILAVFVLHWDALRAALKVVHIAHNGNVTGFPVRAHERHGDGDAVALFDIALRRVADNKKRVGVRVCLHRQRRERQQQHKAQGNKRFYVTLHRVLPPLLHYNAGVDLRFDLIVYIADNFAVDQRNNTVGILCHLRIVRDKHDRLMEPLGKIADHVHDLFGRF